MNGSHAQTRMPARLALALGTAAVTLVALVAASPALARTAAPAGHASASSSTVSGCIAHPLPRGADIYYSHGCTGHDEPELDPVSSAPHSARDLTWTAILPSNGSTEVDAVGPTFWWGGALTDPHSLGGQAFFELQFYPNAMVTKCGAFGGFQLTRAEGVYTACDPVWRIHGNIEDAAFNGMLRDSAGGGPLVMHEGDAVTVHEFDTPAHDGLHITVRDKETGHHGTLVLNSAQDGPLNPIWDRQEIGNALYWGLVHDTPMSFVWEIGHTSDFSGARFCVPGQHQCPSYNHDAWAGFSPLRITGVRFGDGSQPQKWAVVSDYGGADEVDHYCGSYGGTDCIYPWYTQNGDLSFSYGVDYPTTEWNFGQVAQFSEQMDCRGPFGPNTQYCDNILRPTG